VLAAGAVGTTASTLLGYLTVFAICGVTALVAAVLLFLVPKLSFADVEVDEALLPGAVSEQGEGAARP